MLELNQIAFGVVNGNYFLLFQYCVMLFISLSLTVTFLGSSSLQILMSVLPRCIIVMPILCVLTCLDPIVVTASRDTSVWMISPAQVSS